MTTATRRQTALALKLIREVDAFECYGFPCIIQYDPCDKTYPMLVDSQVIGNATTPDTARTTISTFCEELSRHTRATTADMAADVQAYGDYQAAENAAYLARMAAKWGAPDAGRSLLPTLDAELAAQGLRLADEDEAGWYVPVNGGKRVWATDKIEMAETDKVIKALETAAHLASPTWTDDKIAAGFAPDASDDDRSLALALSNLRTRAQNECPCGSSCPCCDPSHPEAIEQRLEREEAERDDPDLEAFTPAMVIDALRKILDDTITARLATTRGTPEWDAAQGKVMTAFNALAACDPYITQAAHMLDTAAKNLGRDAIRAEGEEQPAPPYAELGDDPERETRDALDAGHAADETDLDRVLATCRACERADCAGVQDIQRCGGVRAVLLAPYDKGAGTGGYAPVAFYKSVPVDDDPCAVVRAELEKARQVLETIVALASGWDEHGALGPREPLSWETVARMAMDYARAALG